MSKQLQLALLSNNWKFIYQTSEYLAQWAFIHDCKRSLIVNRYVTVECIWFK